MAAIENLIAHPASMTHAAMSTEARTAAGIGDGLLRLPVGIEDQRDLAHDLVAALERALRPVAVGAPLASRLSPR